LILPVSEIYGGAAGFLEDCSAKKRQLIDLREWHPRGTPSRLGLRDGIARYKAGSRAGMRAGLKTWFFRDLNERELKEGQ